MENKNTNQNPSEATGIKKILLMFWQYLKNLAYDFITSFKYNNMKLPGVLIAVPGVFIGFFLKNHAPVVTNLSFATSSMDGYNVIEGTLIPFDFSGLVIFLLMLFGILNIFTAASVIGKKNLGSVVMATLSTLVVVVCGILYLYLIFAYAGFVTSGQINIDNYTVGQPFPWTSDHIISIITVIVSMLCSIAGVILGFIFYDRTYEKVDR